MKSPTSDYDVITERLRFKVAIFTFKEAPHKIGQMYGTKGETHTI